MSEVKSLPYYNSGLESAFIFLSVLSAAVLLIVWALAGTIAARNISIVTGLFASSIWVLLVRPKITRLDLIVPALLMGVPIWLWVIYFFFSIDPVAQYKEMTGTWLRVMLLIIFGFNLGLIISKNIKLARWVWFALAMLPVASLIVYLHDVRVGGAWDIPGYTAFFKTKIAGVYFLMWPIMLSYGSIAYIFIKLIHKNYSFSSFMYLFTQFVLIFICFFLFHVFHALNGFIVASFFSVILVIRISIKFPHLKIILALFIFLSIFLFIFLKVDLKFDYEDKFINLISDISLSLNLDSNESWRHNGYYSLPLRGSGDSVNGSTYERVSWFLKGLHFLWANPLGSGDTSFSFGTYMQFFDPNSSTTKTHSGWLDFALGAGIPGLLLIWFANYWISRKALSAIMMGSKQAFPFVTLWMIVGIWFLLWPGELSYREFLEHYVFMISFLGSCVFSLDA